VRFPARASKSLLGDVFARSEYISEKHLAPYEKIIPSLPFAVALYLFPQILSLLLFAVQTLRQTNFVASDLSTSGMSLKDGRLATWKMQI